MLGTGLVLALALPASARDDGRCLRWAAGEEVGRLPATLDEPSGLAASHAAPGVLWLHNDAGGENQLYAVGPEGEALGTWVVVGVENQDWEDLALGPCPPGEAACACLHLADIGDNDGTRGGGVIWRIPEPDVSGTAHTSQVAPVDALWFRYPSGAFDAEAILVHPDTGEVLVVTKAEGDEPARVYAFPDLPPVGSTAAAPTELAFVATLDLEDHGLEDSAVTAGAVSPAGARVLVRTDDDMMVYDTSGGGMLEGFWLDPFDDQPLGGSGPGEALTFSPDGRTLWFTRDEPAPSLWRMDCAEFEPGAVDTADPLVDCADDGPGPCGCGPAGAGPALLPLAFVLARLRRRDQGSGMRRTQP